MGNKLKSLGQPLQSYSNRMILPNQNQNQNRTPNRTSHPNLNPNQYPFPNSIPKPKVNQNPNLLLNSNLNKNKPANPNQHTHIIQDCPSSSSSNPQLQQKQPTLNLRPKSVDLTISEGKEISPRDSGKAKQDDRGTNKEMEKKVGYGRGKNQIGRYGETEKFFSIFRQTGEEPHGSQSSKQREDGFSQVRGGENVRGNELVEWKEKGEDLLNLMRLGGHEDKIWSIADDKDMEVQQQLIGVYGGPDTGLCLIEQGAQGNNAKNRVRDGKGEDLQFLEEGDHQSLVVYEEPVPLISESSSDWVLRMTDKVAKMIGVNFEGFENEWETLLTKIENDRKSKISKSKGKGSRELRNLASSITYKGKDTRGIKVRGKFRLS